VWAAAGRLEQGLPIGLVISLVGLSLLSAGLAVYWGVVIGHIVRTRRNIPTARDGERMVADAANSGVEWPEVCVVVPAHNEEACIATVARALIGQEYPKLRIVFALDRCTDGTRRVLEDAVGADRRVEIVEVRACPEDWAGKVHAIWRGVQDSEGGKRAHVLTFLDADTKPGARCVWACVALMRSRGLEMLSLLSTMTGTKWFDRVVEPAAGMELIRQYPLERANEPDAEKRRAFANGQFIMITRAGYERIGGHERVRQALLEDIEIAREVARAKLPAGMFMADGVHECRMYESWEQFERGWERIYIESCNRKPERLRQFATRVRVLGVWMPLAAAVCVGLGAAALVKWKGDPLAMIAIACGVAGLGLMIAGVMMVYRTSRTALWGAIGYPLGAWLVGSIMRRAAKTLERGGKTKWGGREYELTAR
jgi:Glycosyltransferase like family 2